MDRIAKLKAFLTANPADAFVQHALALEYIKAGDDQQARSLFESLLSRNPQYIGSYYHLAKLLERIGEPALAILWYEKGIQEAGLAGDRHTQNELQMAYNEITD